MGSYDTNIDKATIRSLYENENGKMSSGKLKCKVEEYSRNGKTISPTLFSFHLRQMLISDRKHSRYLVSPVLHKQDSERGEKIFYSLSNNARIRLNLKLPILREESAREKAYQLFLNFMAFQNVPTDDSKSVKLSEEEFEHFFAKNSRVKN